jgi:class 3 adenylate cyclase
LGSDERPQAAKGSEAYPRARLGRKLVASHRVQHPPRQADLYSVGQADHHDVIVSPAQYTHGDSFFVVFLRATQAVAAAIASQRALTAEAWPDGGIVRVRIGMHTGEPIRTAHGYTGLGVIRGARIKAAVDLESSTCPPWPASLSTP